jgi:hypothetical protein
MDTSVRHFDTQNHQFGATGFKSRPRERLSDSIHNM